MIHLQTRLRTIDNSGAKHVQCINISNKKFARIGDSILVAVKSSIANSTLNKKMVYKAHVLQTKRALKRPDGVYFRCGQNAVALLKQNDELLANRIKSFTFFETNRHAENVV